MFSFEGDTGPYLQYAHARLCSVARKGAYSREELLAADVSLLKEKHAFDLIRLLAQYPDMVGQTLKTQEPTTILTYLFRLTHQLSSTYDVLARRRDRQHPLHVLHSTKRLARCSTME